MLFSFLIYINTISSRPLSTRPLNELDDQISDTSRGIFQTLWFNQTLDHNSANSTTFKQKYLVNAQYYKSGGPVFLYIEGESALRNSSVTNGNMVQLAIENNGMIFGLEHRFYGDSQPFDEWTLDNLKYLSSLNGVKDAGNFIKNVINPTTNKPFKNTKWITTGGSYAGALSAWIKEEYPKEVFIGYASSAPVLAKADFYEYDQVVASALGPQCASEMNSIKNYIDGLFDDKTRFNKLKSDFNCTDVEDDDLFLYTIADILAYIVQYNLPTTNPNIDTFCSGLVSQSDMKSKINHYIDQTNKVRNNNGYTCKSFEGYDTLKAIKANNKDVMKQWTYQSCQEWGFWQTAPKNGISTRSKRLTLKWFYDYFCSEKFFGKKIGPSDPNITNNYFKALNNSTPRTLWVNGDADPWHALSVINTQNSTLDRPIYLIKNGSHSADLYPDSATDSAPLTDTRKKIRSDISRWLKLG
ncbi:peptidase S28 [Conidiobolus coronatus NRRL 28638]|uniref:Peptidase S28 n=1 Tax=Conidiobolus coronatus (strain ATCC 28846 / CBS 209.66 / NRRL 28638) TaxID=796925 RepID=A0A137PCT5_CONC2|nr:peptidase S28 [Conidiobolus coronatus NRRL 28638]|eukprot:KXN72814.1 peptidase S28 [Conidiobolus coronatus NRRL 28638]